MNIQDANDECRLMVSDAIAELGAALMHMRQAQEAYETHDSSATDQELEEAQLCFCRAAEISGEIESFVLDHRKEMP